MHQTGNDLTWFVAMDDRLVFQALMAGTGLPLPPLLGGVHPRRSFAGTAALGTPGAIAVFLRGPSDSPLFGKPIDGMHSLAPFSAVRYDAATDAVVLHDGAPAAVAEVTAELAASGKAHLLQRTLEPAPAIAARCGLRLWGQLLVVLRPDRLGIARAVGKIPTGNAIADNFWRSDNMLGAVELAWAGARALPGVRTQAWDLVLTAGGPAILEAKRISRIAVIGCSRPAEAGATTASYPPESVA